MNAYIPVPDPLDLAREMLQKKITLVRVSLSQRILFVDMHLLALRRLRTKLESLSCKNIPRSMIDVIIQSHLECA